MAAGPWKEYVAKSVRCGRDGGAPTKGGDEANGKQPIPGGRKAVIKPSKGGELRKRETKKIKVGSLSGTLLAFCDPFRSVPSRPFFSRNAPSN